MFFDEAEWVLCKREGQSSTVMQQVTPVLLAQLGRILKERSRAVVVIAATNRPELVDPAFLRPGRFDKLFYVGLPNTKARTEILRTHIKGRQHSIDEPSLSDLAGGMQGYSGADVELIVEEVAYSAFGRRNGGAATICAEDILQVIGRTPKSVTPAEVEALDEWARGRHLL